MTDLLTHKQILFVEHYIQNGGNGTAAARAAGWGSTATLGAVAYENLNKPHIGDEIGRRQAEFRNQMTVTTEAKRQRLWAIAEIGRGRGTDDRDQGDPGVESDGWELCSTTATVNGRAGHPLRSFCTSTQNVTSGLATARALCGVEATALIDWPGRYAGLNNRQSLARRRSLPHPAVVQMLCTPLHHSPLCTNKRHHLNH